jgi:hypothetical protein
MTLFLELFSGKRKPRVTHIANFLQGSSTEALAKTKTEYEAFLGDPAKLKEVRERMKVR